MIPIWSGIGAHVSRYDAWLCDIWGVLHNGTTAFPGVAEACARYRAGGGRILLVSNAPRPAGAVAVQLEKLGITAACYDGILTSGDVTRDMLRKLPRGAIYHIGPERDLGLFDGLDAWRVDETSASLIVCSGLFDDTTETPEAYRAQLHRLADREVPMLCANPDITVERGGQIIYCAGALAKLYGELGGIVTYAGKPHAEVYRVACERLAAIAGQPVASSRTLAVGDGVFTDIEGAAAAGIDSLYIASPIYLKEPFSVNAVERLFGPRTFQPTAAMPVLTW